MREIMPLELAGKEIHKGSDWKHATYEVPGPCACDLYIITSCGFSWDHVSVSTKNRCPNWLEMNFVKDLFWGPEEVVFQLHPAKKDYINAHPYVLHLWKHQTKEIPLPPKWMVGPYDGWENDIPKELR